MYKLYVCVCVCIVFTEGERGLGEKSSSAKHRQRHLGSWLPDSLLGMSPKQSACPGHHTAWWDSAGSPKHSMQGEPILTGWQQYWRIFMRVGFQASMKMMCMLYNVLYARRRRSYASLHTKHAIWGDRWFTICLNLFSFIAHKCIACTPAHTHIVT